MSRDNDRVIHEGNGLILLTPVIVNTIVPAAFRMCCMSRRIHAFVSIQTIAYYLV